MAQDVKGNPSILERKKKILITSALPYVNNVPHLGNLIGCVLSADVFARFCKSYGCDTIYVCGTDEHGTTTEQKAIEDGVTPKEVCDKYYAIHKDIYEWFQCDFDCFGRTSSQTNHEVAKDIFTKLDANGYVIEQDTIQMYDPKAERYLPDRFVEGTCPKCGYESARGDQCDNCGNLLNPEDLIDPKSTITGETPEQRKEAHLFIDLPKLAPELKRWIDRTAREAHWSQNALTMTEGWLKTGLKPRGISRNLKWGVQIPKEGFTDKVFYSWFDAPIGYIGITKDARDDWKQWWHNPEETELYQFMGKDNIPFHTIMFPSFLIGSKDHYTLLHQISSTEYLNYEHGAFSKSRGIGVFGNDAMESGIPADIWRYYLLINRPETADTQFTWKDFQEKNNSELLANLGNFVNRTFTFIMRNYDGVIPKPELDDHDKEFLKSADEHIDRITRLMSIISIKESLKEIMMLSRSGNQYFQESQPWATIKDDATKKKAGTSMYICANLARKLAILLEPFIPETAGKIAAMLNIEPQRWTELDRKKDLEDHQINPPKILFRKFEDEEIARWQETYAGKQKKKVKSEFSKANLKVAEITSAEDHPDADKLLVLQISLGSEKRQLVAGLKGYYTKDELIGKHIVIVSNLKPAKLRGKESQGMLLAADDGTNVKVLEAPQSKPGSQVRADDDEEIGSETIEFEDFMKVTITTKDGKAMFKDKVLHTDAEKISVDISDGAKVR